MKIGRRRLPLTALRVFEAAARLESFKDAAAELGVSATTVSNQIRSLEREWGRALFIRKTRHVVPTAAGLSLSRVVSQSFDAISREIDQHVAQSRSVVTMTVGAMFGFRWLTPRLGLIRSELPEIELTIQKGRRISGPSEMHSAIAIDWGTGDWPGLHSEFLLAIRYAPVLSPALARRVGRISHPRDLAQLPVLHQHDRTEWTQWLALAGVAGQTFASETIIEDANIVIQAAIDGQGVALGSFPFIDDEIDAGRLLKPFDLELLPTRSYHILTKPGGRRRTEVDAVCAWLKRNAASRHRQRRRWRHQAIAVPSEQRRA